MLIKTWFENIDRSKDPFLWATKETLKPQGSVIFLLFLVWQRHCMLFLSDEQGIYQEVHKAEWPKQKQYQGRI